MDKTRNVNRAGPNAGRAGLGPNFFSRAGPARSDFLIRYQSGPDLIRAGTFIEYDFRSYTMQYS